MTTPTPDLRALLDAATPGPWEVDGEERNTGEYDVLVNHHDENEDALKYEYVSNFSSLADARLIAQAPTLAAKVIAAEGREAKVRELHKAEATQAITAYDCCNEDCDHECECPTEAIEVCAECHRIAGESYPYFGEDGLGNVIYPCPTIRILNGEGEK